MVRAYFILLLATALRFYRLGYQSLWSDEGNSVSLARAGLAEIAARTAFDIHPPLYYWLLSLWTHLFGETEFAIRALSAVLGVLVVAVIYRLGCRLFDQRVALAAALIAALSPFQIYYAQEGRMYMLLALASALTVWAAVSAWLTLKHGRWPWWPLVGYSLAATAGLYTQYAFPVVLAAVNLAAVAALWRSRRSLLIWLGWQFVPLLLYLPWLPIAYRQLTTWPSLVEAATPDEIGLTLLRVISLGPPAEAVADIWLLPFAALALLGLVFAWRHRPWQTALWLVGLWLALPALVTALLFRPAYLKIFLMAGPAWALLVALGLTAPYPLERRSPVWLSLVWLGPILLVTTLPGLRVLDAYYHDPTYQRDNYRGIAAFIEGLAGPQDAVILFAPGQQEVFDYYYRPGPERAKVYPLPRQRPLDPAATVADLQELAARADRLYGVFWATSEADPEGLIEAWLAEHTFKARDIWFGNVRLVSYATGGTEIPLTALDASFGDQIRLTGYGLARNQLRPGEILQLRLAWEADQPLVVDYTVFVQLLDPANHLVGQRDAPPGQPTSTWPAEQTISDQHGLYLEPGTPPGPQRLVVGLYDSATGVRLPVNGGPADYLELATIQVQPNTRPLPLEAFRMQQRLDGPPLLGYDLHKLGAASGLDDPLRPGDPLHLNLYWQNSPTLANTETVTLRLLNREAESVTEWQYPLAGIDYPPSAWPAGGIVRAQFDLFLGDLPPGLYRLEIVLGAERVGLTHPLTISDLEF